MSNKPYLRSQLLFAVSLFFFAASSATAAETRIETALNDGGKAVIVCAGNPLKAMTETPFAIELYNSAGAPVKDATLKLSLTMPFMPMPPNHPAVRWTEAAYRGIAIFTMAGAWQINVDIARPGIATEQAVFNIEMVVMQ